MKTESKASAPKKIIKPNYSISIASRKIGTLQCLFIAFIILISGTATANDNADFQEITTYQQFSASYIIGGQVYNDNFIYNPGFAIQGSYGAYINPDVSIGLGLGYQAHTSERFMPIFLEVTGYKKHKSNSPFIKMQLGYALGWNTSFPENIDYQYTGGPTIDVGMGRRINLKGNYDLVFQWSYRHQFASIKYQTYGSENFTQNLNYDMLVVTLGLIYKNR